MKAFFIWIIASLCVCINLSAQGGRRGGSGGGGGNRDFGGTPRVERSQSPAMSRDYDQIQISEFPEITGLEVDKKLKLFSIVKEEHKNILKLMDQKQELQAINNRTDKQKEIDRNLKNISKLDEKITKESQNADKKIKAVLTNDQYKEFVEKKDQIKFNDPPVLRRREPANGNTRTPRSEEE